MLEKQDVKRNRGGRANGEAADAAGRIGASRARPRKADTEAPSGMAVQRYFTRVGDDGYAGVQWELRTANISGENGKTIFEQRDVEVPATWSQTATNVVV